MRVTLPFGTAGKQPGDVHNLPDDEALSLIRKGLAEKAPASRRSASKSAPKTPEMGTPTPEDTNTEKEG